ncbi:MAG TPA: hypothetical protein VHD76_10220 [Bryobacteraceae bacterium]|jgi:Rod binding domain-containing protein|nr:hypothetical protein [Bryobacteraceae bacterium]
MTAPVLGFAPGSNQAKAALNEPGPGASTKDSPEKILQAAREFEALLIGQLLQGTQDGAGWGGEDDAEDSMVGGIAQQQFALALSKNGGLGLADTIAAGLTRAQSTPHGSGAIRQR